MSSRQHQMLRSSNALLFCLGIVAPEQEHHRFFPLIQLVNDGDFTVEKAAAKVNMTSEDFLKKREEYKKETL